MNKVLLVGLVCLALALAINISQDAAFGQFRHFITKYNKVYATEEELNIRFQNYKDSVIRINLKNQKSKGTVFGINKFSDLTTLEFRDLYLMKNGIPATREDKKQDVLVPPASLQLPTIFDWRDKGAVTPVKDQGQCGSCWAFSATENIESMWILHGNATNSTLRLAPQQIVDCDQSDTGCNGGDTTTAYDYVISAGGLEPEVDYPYTAEDGNCNFISSDVVAKISNWKYATSWYSETTLQQNLVSWGPLSICVDASNWQDYSSGVMTWSECSYLNILDHCVQLVGYNQDSSLPMAYWIVRNSWGTDWGVNGYIWLQMFEDTCGIAHEATTAII